MPATAIFSMVALLFSLATFASAQNTRDKPEPEADTTVYELEQVTVTALRYPEQILKVPLAISFLNKVELQNLRGYGMDEALKGVPGVLAQSRYGNHDVRITIRGFGARGAGDRSNAGTTRGIRVLLDGAPETEPDGRTSFDLIDLAAAQSIEVIRSNASAVWGNAAGGVINITSAPIFDAPFLSPEMLRGSFGLQKFGLEAGTMVGDGRLALRLTSTTFEGWRENSSSERTLVNISLLSNPGELTKLGVYLVGANNKFFIPGPLSRAEFDSRPQQANATYLKRGERRHNRLGRITIALDRDRNETHGFSSLVFVEPKFLQRSERGTFRDFTRYHAGGNILYHHMLNLSAFLKSKFQIGGDEAYQDGAILFYTLSPTNGRGSTLRQNKREGANSLGIFLQEELTFHQAVTAVLGMRYNNVTYYYEDFLNSTRTDKKSFARWTPKVGLTYQFSPTQSVYANWGSGVEVPAGNETDPAATFGQDTVYAINPLLAPIRSTTMEFGTKQIFVFHKAIFLRALSLELAAYRIGINNDIIPYRGGRFYFTAGKTRRLGVEAGANMQMDYGMTLQAAFTYSANKYIDYKVDSLHYGRPGKFADYKNNKVAGIPDFFYNIAWRFAPARAFEAKFLHNAYLEISMQGVGGYFVDDANQTKVPAYKILNFTMGLKNPLYLTENLAMRGFVAVNNLTDTKYAASAFINPDVLNAVPIYLEPGLPRNFVIGVSLSQRKKQ